MKVNADRSRVTNLIKFRESLIQEIRCGKDEEVAVEIKDFIQSRPPNIDITDWLEQVGFFWDVCAAAIEENAIKTFFSMEEFKKNGNVLSNLVNLTLKSDNVEMLESLICRGWNFEWSSISPTLTERSWETLAPKMYAETLKKNSIIANKSYAIGGGVGLSTFSKVDFLYKWSAIGSGIKWWLNSDKEEYGLKQYLNRFSNFVDCNKKEFDTSWGRAGQKYKKMLIDSYIEAFIVSTEHSMRVKNYGKEITEKDKEQVVGVVVGVVDVLEEKLFSSKAEWLEVIRKRSKDSYRGEWIESSVIKALEKTILLKDVKVESSLKRNSL